MRWLVLVALGLAGCLAGTPPPDGGVPPAGFLLDSFERLVVDGGDAAEPHIAVRGDALRPTIVVASIVYLAGEGPTEDERFWIAMHRKLGDAPWESALLPPSVVEPLELGPEMRFVGDPVLAYGPAGDLYLGGVAASGVWKGGVLVQLNELSVFLTKSDDDGATWAPAIFHKRGAGTFGFPVLFAGLLQDKEWVAVAADGTVHFTWTEFVQTVSILHHVRSTDGGATWSEPADIGRGDPDSILTATTIAAPDANRVYVAATHHRTAAPDVAAPGVMLLWSSDDAGATFSGPTEVGPSASFRFGSTFADPARPERVLVAGTTDGTSRVWLRESRDAGGTWDAPVWLAEGRDGDQLQPAGWVDAAGRAHVVFYDAGWSGGERAVRVVVEDGAVAFEGVAEGDPIDPGARRRDYLGIAGVESTSWAVWVDGVAPETTVGLARLTAPGS